MSKFIVGINLPCIDNQYDHDIGSNEVRGIEYGDQPLQSTFKDTKKHFEKYLETISSLGVKVVRLWLFERFEGLQFNSDGSVFGISKDMVYNLKDACKIAQKYNVKFYFCLMDTWGVLADDLKNSPKGDPRVKYAAILNGLITTPSKRKSFLNLVANLLVKDDDIKNSVWAVDVLNEPDGIERTQTMESSIQGKIDTGITWDHLYDYINDACDTIKNNAGHKVSCGIRSEYLQQFVPHIKDKVDFFDIHLANSAHFMGFMTGLVSIGLLLKLRG